MASDLTIGSAYNFYVIALNFNGQSSASPIALLYSCLIPSDLAIPTYSSSTSTSLTISWSPPLHNNGCILDSYALF